MVDLGDLRTHLELAADAMGADLLLPRGAAWTPPPAVPIAAAQGDRAVATAPTPSTTAGPEGQPAPLETALSETALPEKALPEKAPRETARTAPPEAAPAPSRSDPGSSPAATPSAAPDLETLRALVAQCERCKLSAGRTQTVFGEGDPTAEVLFVGEAPGANEDRTGRPFCGPAGELLDRIIHNAMGLRREETFIANVNKCRPPGNRDPEPDEVAACLPFLRRQIQLIQPKVIVTLGRIAAHNLLGTTLPMRALRGRELELNGVPVVATWHPAYLLRTPSAKRDTWEDIKRVNRLLGRPEVPPRPGGPRS